MSKYIYIFKKNLIGETILKLKADKVTFQVGDIVYVSENDKKNSFQMACCEKK